MLDCLNLIVEKYRTVDKHGQIAMRLCELRLGGEVVRRKLVML